MSGDRIEPTGPVPAYVPRSIGEPRSDDGTGSHGKRKRAARKKKKKGEPAAVPNEPMDEDPSEPPHLIDYRAADVRAFQPE